MAEAVHTAERLAELQALPLNRKIQITQTRIIEWYQRYKGQVCVSFSGGKDSAVLLHIARQLYPNIPAVFSNTGLEYPEIQRFVKSKDNIDIVTPSMRFDEVISTYGYPLISKEVAEAIYYARRIRSQTVNVEREREQERQAEADGAGRDAEADGRKFREADFRMKDLHGIRKTGESSKQENSCKESNGSCKIEGGGGTHLIQTSTARNRRTVLSGRMGIPNTELVQLPTEEEISTQTARIPERDSQWKDWRRGCL